jgi:hypothetical protein
MRSIILIILPIFAWTPAFEGIYEGFVKSGWDKERWRLVVGGRRRRSIALSVGLRTTGTHPRMWKAGSGNTVKKCRVSAGPGGPVPLHRAVQCGLLDWGEAFLGFVEIRFRRA